MGILSNARSFARVLKPPASFLVSNRRLLSSGIRPHSSLHGQICNNTSSGMCREGCSHPVFCTLSESFSTEAGNTSGSPTESVKELHDKMLESVNVKRTMPPNASLWSLLGSCKNREDIELLFNVLKNLRRFRLSNLRIHDNFNCNLCREVTKTCVHVGALDFGKKALWKHNVYGLSPTVGSAHHLLLHAKDCNDDKLMVEVMDLVKKNNLPLQPGTADIVLRICYDTDNWELISKYAKRFAKAGVKLRKTSFDVWMKFAVKRGDTESLWKIEKLRSETVNQHSVTSALSCAKGFLLESKPQEAADIIQLLNQTLPDSKRSAIADELEKLVNEWPFDVIKHQKEEDRKALAASLKSNILSMVGLLSSGFSVSANLQDLDKNEIMC